MLGYTHIAEGYLVGVAATSSYKGRLSKSDLRNLIAWGILCGYLPDLDALIYFWKKRSFQIETDFRHHTWPTHTLPVYIILASVIDLWGRWFNSDKVRLAARMLLMGSAVHLLSDTLISGDGIMWKYPLDRKMTVVFNMDAHGLEFQGVVVKHPSFLIELAIIQVALLTWLKRRFSFFRNMNWHWAVLLIGIFNVFYYLFYVLSSNKKGRIANEQDK